MSVIVQHGGGGAAVAAPKGREIMRVALLKDADIRARITAPMPLPEVDPVAPGAEQEGEAPAPPSEVIPLPLSLEGVVRQ
jgi:penicillin-binding protein 2